MANDLLFMHDIIAGRKSIQCNACRKCREPKALFRCSTCRQYLCNQAVKRDQESAGTCEHKLQDFDAASCDEKAIRLAVLEIRSFCKSHMGQYLGCFCETCEIPICATCSLDAHAGHQHKTLAVVEKSLKATLSELLDGSSQRLQAMEDGITNIKKRREEIDLQAENLVSTAREAFKSLYDVLQRKELQVSADIESAKAKKLASLREQEKKLSAEVLSTRPSLSLVSSMMKMGSVADLLSYKAMVTARLEEIKSLQVQPEPCEEADMKVLINSKVVLESVDNLGGQQDWTPSKETFKLTTSELRKSREEVTHVKKECSKLNAELERVTKESSEYANILKVRLRYSKAFLLGTIMFFTSLILIGLAEKASDVTVVLLYLSALMLVSHFVAVVSWTYSDLYCELKKIMRLKTIVLRSFLIMRSKPIVSRSFLAFLLGSVIFATAIILKLKSEKGWMTMAMILLSVLILVMHFVSLLSRAFLDFSNPIGNFQKKFCAFHRVKMADTNGEVIGVTSMCLSADGQIAALSGKTPTDQNVIQLWEVPTGTLRRTLRQSNEILGLAFSTDRKLLASCSDDSTVLLWNVEHVEEVKVLEGHTDWVTSVSLAEDGKWCSSGSEDQTVRVWSVRTGKEIKVLKGHTDTVNAVAMSSDGALVVSGSDDKTVHMWHVISGTCIKKFQGHADIVKSVVLSQDGRLVVSGSADKTIRVWDVSTGSSIRVLSGYSGAWHSVSITSNAKYVAAPTQRGKLCVWAVDDGRLLLTLDAKGSPHRASMSADGKVIASFYEGRLQFWSKTDVDE
eukprot:CAMPEP_0184658372 /NCGR_PEP_ID=MMETSP0308-20130426/25222_1 /TAXON_ID=38269 /ORGANISM="Gloeochaete witrockiana, Strain SAG 46.84" /LENGTH=793 /DNA_ID=CAMNT_0027097317 /DNA_START=435 /DNA_END=2816 /DNA_ORIENTATION=+